MRTEFEVKLSKFFKVKLRKPHIYLIANLSTRRKQQ